jgi:hypothetical protein
MFELLCRWADDPASSLHNNFLKEVITARGGSFCCSSDFSAARTMSRH